MRCGQGPGGGRVPETGLCPAATATHLDGTNGGANGGRVCWAVAGTFCSERIRGEFARRRLTCLTCAFHQQVRSDEGTGFQLMPDDGTCELSFDAPGDGRSG